MKDEALKLKNIYWRMKRIRMVEEQIAKKYAEGKMRCPTHLSIGQEAVPATIAELTRKEDTVVSTHRCHAHYLAKGGNLNKMIAEIYGKENGCSKGKGGSMHLIDKSCGFMGSSAIVGNSIPVGVGIALSFELKKLNNISVVYFGEGATEEGIFYESVNFAALRKLNVLFVCENNKYSVYSPLSVRQPSTRSIVGIAKEMGMKDSVNIDGNDPKSLLKECEPIINDIKNGKGPALIHCSTYRWREHCGPGYDNNLGYRSKVEFEKWKRKDPIKKIEREILDMESNISSRENTKTCEIELEIKNAFDFAELSTFPRREEAYRGIYAEK